MCARGVEGRGVGRCAPLRATVPKVVDPDAKVTLPVGIGPELVAVAVNIKLCPAKLGLAEDVTAVAEAAAFTVTGTAAELSAA